MDTSAYNLPPVKAARGRIFSAQRMQRAVGLELLALYTKTTDSLSMPFRGVWDLPTLHRAQKEAYDQMCEARCMLVWLEKNNIQDVRITDEASLVAGAEQRAQVELEYYRYLKNLDSNP